MKNYRLVSTRTIRFPIPDAPPLQGWGIKLLSEVKDAEWKPGFWLAKWNETPDFVEVGFEEGLHLTINTEADAKKVDEDLRSNVGVETEIVKVGNPQN